MAVEPSSRAALIAADDKAYRVAAWKAHSETLHFAREEWASDANAKFDKTLTINATAIAPLLTWGTSPDLYPANS